MVQTDFLEQALAFQLKGSMVTLTTLELTNDNLQQLDQQLGEKVAQAPGFFHDAPFILAVDKRHNLTCPLDLPAILQVFSKHKLRIMALRAQREEDIQAAATVNLPVLPPTVASERPLLPTASTPVVAYHGAKVIHTPVRSGQQIHAKDGDLIVLAAVSAGAELLADGHIHVYGPLRGRALAGINGNEQARVFCQQLGAELISIAGQYKIAEDLRRIPAWGAASQIFLQDQQMIIQAM